MFRFPNSELTEAEAGSEVQIAPFPADQQEPARKGWVNVLAPVQAPRTVAMTGCGEGVNVV